MPGGARLYGEEESLTIARSRFPDLADVDALYLPSLLKLIAAHGGPGEIRELADQLKDCPAHALHYVLSTLGTLHWRLPAVDLPASLDEPLARLVRAEVLSLTRHHALTLLTAVRQAGGQLSALTPCLENPDRLARMAAIEAFAQCGDATASDVLAARRMVEPDAEVRQALDRAIQTLQRSR